MFKKQYYTLVAGLREYSLDSAGKEFDAPAIIAEIREGVSPADRQAIDLLYGWYDMENILAMRAGRTMFGELGNFSREELEGELAAPTNLPGYVAEVFAAYSGDDDEPGEEIDMSRPLERSLTEAYYRECARSSAVFMRRWGDFDRTLRNVAAAIAARRVGIPVADVVVGYDEVTAALVHSQAADFGLRGEVDYLDEVIAAVGGTDNAVEREHRMDTIRWEMADSLSETDYFGIGFLLAYLIKVNIIYRWVALDAAKGRELMRRLVERMTALADPASRQEAI